MFAKYFGSIKPVLMEGSKVYFLVGRTFFYRFGVAFDRQLIPGIGQVTRMMSCRLRSDLPSSPEVFVSSILGSNSLFERVRGAFRDIFDLNLFLQVNNHPLVKDS